MSCLCRLEYYRQTVITAVRSPALSRASTLIETGINEDAFITAVGDCTVATPEQAFSRARRHVLVKPDGTVVVHGETGTEPQAVHPPVGGQTVTTTESKVVLTVDDSRSESALVVSFLSVQQLSVAGAPAAQQATTEADLTALVLEQPAVIEPGFRPLATERQTGAGPVDVYGEDEDGRTVVLELKSHRAGPAAVGQLGRYVAALRDELHTGATVRGILGAPSVTDRAHRRLAEEGLEFVTLPPTQAPP